MLVNASDKKFVLAFYNYFLKTELRVLTYSLRKCAP